MVVEQLGIDSERARINNAKGGSIQTLEDRSY
jgi:hypothetical protein